MLETLLDQFDQDTPHRIRAIFSSIFIQRLMLETYGKQVDFTDRASITPLVEYVKSLNWQNGEG